MLSFIHIPKTAGKSIRTWLDQHNIVEMDPTVDDHKYGRDLPIKENEISFSVVRNPWDRLVSWYDFEINLNQHPLSNLFRERGFSYWLHNYVTLWCVDGYFTHLTPQVEWLLSDTLVLKFENLKSHFRVIQNMTKVYDPLPPNINATFGYTRNKHYSHYYNEDDVEFVRHHFQQDIERFGYSFQKMD